MDEAAPYAWSVAAPVVDVEQDVPITIEAVDTEGNLASVSHTIRVRSVAPGDPPVVTLGCPSPGARLAPGTGLDFAVSATHDEGVERVELLVGDDPTPVATDFTAPYDFHYDVPVDTLEGEVIVLHFRARSLGGVYGEAVYPVAVIAANVVSADAFLASTDTSLDGSSVVVAAGTLTVEGLHTFRDLVVLGGAAVTHPASTADTTERLDVALTRDLFVACGGAVEATAKGYPGGVTYHEPGSAAQLLGDDFNDGDFAGWQIVDEGEENGPSSWYVSGGILRQDSNIVSQIRPGFGTSLVWPEPLPADDFRFSALMRTVDDDTFGLMFRYTDPGNTYRFVWNRQGSYRLLEKVVDGERVTLAQDAVPYATQTWYRVEIVADGPRLELWIDGQRIFDVTDATHSSGSVGTFCAANAGSYYDDLQVIPLDGPSLLVGASHGGRGGAADGSNRIYDSLFDPKDPGAGGGGLSASPGGGVVRIAAAGTAIIDGTLTARGATASSSL
ncbi:MAG TPA: family 16 glycoside hydrolase, partial [Thermoanaerobaculia bacterium]|nr:family 16 glycoside hydrolase [Thermoanaerobaculia bacterium]